MPSIFHHLKIPDEKPTALVKMRQVFEWLGEVAKTEIVIKGKRQTLGESGVFGDLSGELTSGRPWEISRGELGWIVGRGTIAGFTGFSEIRVPKIGGRAIASDDENDPPLPNPPELPYRLTDGVIAIEAKFDLVYDASSGITDTEAEFLLPFNVFSDTWAAWPEIKWADNINITSTQPVPTSSTSASITIAVPLALIQGGKVLTLRNTNVQTLARVNAIVAIR